MTMELDDWIELYREWEAGQAMIEKDKGEGHMKTTFKSHDKINGL